MSPNQFICIVDDNPDYLLILKYLFRSSLPTYSVQFFDDGETFLAELPKMKQKPSLLVLDRHMPILDGHQILIRVKEDAHSKTIPVVIMSAKATDEEIQGCYQAGASSFITKAADVDQLRNSLIALCQYWIEYNQLPGTN